jgi:phage-related minor tail protein
LPHFSISPAGWKISDLLKGTKPSLSVRWFAEGGIVDTPTLFGAGEAGAEAIVPLKTLWSELDKIADATALNTGNVTINVYARENQSPKQIAEEAVKLLISKENRRRLAWQ